MRPTDDAARQRNAEIERLIAYVEGRLPEEEAIVVRRLLARDPETAELAADFHDFEELAEKYPDAAPTAAESDDMWRSLAARLPPTAPVAPTLPVASASEAAPRRPWGLRLVAAGLAAMVLALGGWVVHLRNSGGPTTQVASASLNPNGAPSVPRSAEQIVPLRPDSERVYLTLNWLIPTEGVHTLVLEQPPGVTIWSSEETTLSPQGTFGCDLPRHLLQEGAARIRVTAKDRDASAVYDFEILTDPSETR